MRAVPLLALVALVAACAGKGGATPRRDAGDAGAVGAGGDGGGGTVAPDDAVAATGGVGSINVKVLWPEAAAGVRASPGYTPCHTPRPARARIGTLHGVAGAFVVVADVPAAAAPAGAPTSMALRLTVRDCAVAPSAAATAVAPGAGLELQSQDGAHALVVERIGTPWLEDDILVAPVVLARVQLPVFGHTVAVPLAAPGAIRVIADGAADDAAWVLAPPHVHAGVTDDDGALGLADVPAGVHDVVAWLPPRAGQPAQRVIGTVTVVGGAAAELTLTIPGTGIAP